MEEPETAPEETKKRSRLPLIIGLVLALVGGVGGFYAVYSGLILKADKQEVSDKNTEVTTEPLDQVAFVKIDPIIVSLPSGSSASLIRFSAQLEVFPDHQAEVEMLLPRVVDVLNGYLRAIEPADLKKPAALVVLRAQMLRRIQIVTGYDRVRDLLIMEFVLT